MSYQLSFPQMHHDLSTSIIFIREVKELSLGLITVRGFKPEYIRLLHDIASYYSI